MFWTPRPSDARRTWTNCSPPSRTSTANFSKRGWASPTLEAKARAVLDARANHPLSTLADLYDPLTMPADLVKAHAELDRAVERCYRSEPFASDRQRVEFLFALYESTTMPLLPVEKTKRRRGRGMAKAGAKQQPHREATLLLGVSST